MTHEQHAPPDLVAEFSNSFREATGGTIEFSSEATCELLAEMERRGVIRWDEGEKTYVADDEESLVQAIDTAGRLALVERYRALQLSDDGKVRELAQA